MEPGEALGIAAQVAVTFGWLRRRGRRVSPRIRARVVAGRQTAFATLARQFHSAAGFCMLGLLLVTIKPTPPTIWRWCSVVAFVVSSVTAITITNTFVVWMCD